MNSRGTLRVLFLLFALSAIHVVMEAQEAISVSPLPTNNYAIPPERTSNTILFDVTITGQHRDMPYRYRYAVDGNWAGTKDLGNGRVMPNPKLSSFGVSLTHGAHSIYVSLQMMTVTNPEEWREVANASTSVALTQYYSITVQNSFGGGNVKVDVGAGGGTYASGTSFTWAKGTSHTLEAINWQEWASYLRWFDNWSGRDIPTPRNISITVTANGNATYTANFLREFNITFQNNLPGAGNVGVIKVSGNLYNITDGPFIAIETYSITLKPSIR